ncbi:MAG: hypothetical protein HY040_10750 [Planctomycetes bacterium]|nr:hypothetical protein [Planctomycetota bacterium]
MMRMIMAIWWTLAIFWLSTHPLEAQSKSKKAARLEDWPTEVKGFGLTEEAAKRDAVTRLREETILYLRSKETAPLVWEPTSEYVKRNLIDGTGKRGDDEEIPALGLAKTWVFPLKQLDLAKIAQLDEQAQRQARVEDRLSLGGYFVGAAIVCLGGTSVLLSAKEWLKKRKLASVAR